MRAVICLCVLLLSTNAQATDLILHSGTIYTLKDDQPAAVEAIAITDGAVVFAGRTEDVRALKDTNTLVVDLGGAWVIPGLTDAHAHLLGAGVALSQVSLLGTLSEAECVERARETSVGLPEGAWLRGRGWDQNDWADTHFPTRESLDAAFGDRPVYFRRVDGHAIWVNTAALRMAGIDANTPDPEGGEILRGADGIATGVLVDNATDIIEALLEDPSPAETADLYHRAIAELHRNGLTGVHDMGTSPLQFHVLQEAEANGWLDLRLVCYLSGAQSLEEWSGGPLRPGPESHLWLDGLKLYADGALGSRGAALLQDYSDRPGHRGLLVTSPEQLRELSREAMRRDLTVTIHAIGDRGVRVSLDAIVGAHEDLVEAGETDRSVASFRPRIEHAQIVNPADFGRFAANGIIASMQPTHCTSDMPWAGERLGEERLVGAYAWRTMLDLGVQLPLGSDFPVENISPWLGLYAARTRHSTVVDRSWSTEQVLSPLEALLGFTVWPARAIGATGWGRLVPGYRADLVIVDHDPLSDDATDLLRTKVLLTMVDGEVVFTTDEIIFGGETP